MPNYARWSQNPAIPFAWAPGDITTFSPDGYTVTTYSDGGVASISAATGKVCFGITTDGDSNLQMGISTAGHFVPGGQTGFNAILLNQALEVGVYIAGVGTHVYNIGGSWGQAVYCFLDCDAGLVWLSTDFVNYYGQSGSVLTAAEVAAGSDGFPWGTYPFYPGGYCTFAGNNNNGTMTFTIVSGQSGFPGTLPAGYTAIPATVQVVSVPTFIPGGALPINWAGGAQTGLDAIINGTTYTLTGQTSGYGGLAYGPVVPDYTIQSGLLVDATYGVDAQPFGPVQANPPGTPLLNFVANANSPTTDNLTLPLSSPANVLSFGINDNTLAHNGSFGESHTLSFQNSDGVDLVTVGIIYPPGALTNGTVTVGSFAPVVLSTGANSQVSGSMTLQSTDGEVTGTLTCTANGTVQSSSVYTFSTGSADAAVTQVAVNTLSQGGGVQIGISVSGSLYVASTGPGYYLTFL